MIHHIKILLLVVLLSCGDISDAVVGALWMEIVIGYVLNNFSHWTFMVSVFFRFVWLWMIIDNLRVVVLNPGVGRGTATLTSFQ